MKENNSTSSSLSALPWYIDLDREPSQSVGHMRDSSHVEQMHSDLGSDWCKALRKTSQDILGVGVGWYGIGGVVRWFGWDVGQIWIRDP